MPEDAQARILKTMARTETNDTSDIVLFLASKKSRRVSGSVVSANRGYLTFCRRIYSSVVTVNGSPMVYAISCHSLIFNQLILFMEDFKNSVSG